MKPEPRFDLRLATRASPDYAGLGWSLFTHLGVVVLVLIGSLRQPDPKAADDPARPPRQLPPQVSMIYLQPPPVARPQPPPEPQVRPPAPDAVHDEAPAPASRRPSEEEGLPSAEQADGAEDAAVRERQPGNGGPEVEKTEPSALPARAVPLPSPGGLARLGWGPSQEWTGLESPERVTCVPKPRDPSAPIELAELVGTVYGSNQRPIPGAFLQVVGTQYSTFSDQAGNYRLQFDAALVEHCRSQFVRVVAQGYRGRNLILHIGPGDNDVLLSR